MRKTGFEVHTHAIVSGPRLSGVAARNEIQHSHFGGDQPHTHEHTGPSCYTIDKDEWRARTGLRGGGRKVFTKEPSGPQIGDAIPIDEEDLTFDVVVCEESLAKFHSEAKERGHSVTGGGLHAAHRMILVGGMRARVMNEHEYQKLREDEKAHNRPTLRAVRDDEQPEAAPATRDEEGRDG